MIALLVWTCGLNQDNFLLLLIEVWETIEDVFFLDGGGVGPHKLHALSTHFVLAILNIFCFGKWLCYLGVWLCYQMGFKYSHFLLIFCGGGVKH